MFKETFISYCLLMLIYQSVENRRRKEGEGSKVYSSCYASKPHLKSENIVLKLNIPVIFLNVLEKANYNYLQQLCREIIEFLLYRGNPRWSKNFNFPKKLLYTILSSFECQVNDGKKSATFQWKIRKNISIQWVVI